MKSTKAFGYCTSIMFHIYTNETFLLLTIFSILTPEKCYIFL